ncbi:MAG: hypothetical protein ACP5HG_07875 [Anaerolineae bacterium]
MMDEIVVAIGDVALALQPSGPEVGIRLQKVYQPFLSKGAEDSRLLVHWGPVPTRDHIQVICASSRGWRVLRQSNRLVFEVDATDISPSALASMNSDLRSGDLHLLEACSSDGSYPAPLARLVHIGLLSQGRGVMMHASGVRVGDEGILFAGTDGVGKTTTARLWAQHADAAVLGDDQIIVRKRGEEYWMYSTPWHGMACVADAVPLKQIYVLRQDNQNRRTPIAPATATVQLLERSFPPLWSQEGMQFTLDFLGELCTSMTIHELGFVPDASAVEFVRCSSDV